MTLFRNYLLSALRECQKSNKRLCTCKCWHRNKKDFKLNFQTQNGKFLEFRLTFLFRLLFEYLSKLSKVSTRNFRFTFPNRFFKSQFRTDFSRTISEKEEIKYFPHEFFYVFLRNAMENLTIIDVSGIFQDALDNFMFGLYD